MIFFSASRALHSECTAFTFVFIINFPNIWNTTLLHHRRHTLSSYFIIYTHTHINCRMIQQFRQHRQRLASTRSPNCILMKISTRKMNWLQPRAGPQQVLWKAKESHCTAVRGSLQTPPPPSPVSQEIQQYSASGGKPQLFLSCNQVSFFHQQHMLFVCRSCWLLQVILSLLSCEN